MADLILDWGLFGGDNTTLTDGSTVETGGVEVTVGIDSENDNASAVVRNNPEYVAPGETFDPDSGLKIFGHGESAGDSTTTTLDFSSTDPAYSSQVSNVSFRINDVDTGTDGNTHVDVVSVRAYDYAGNPVPVTMSNNGTVDISGATATANDPFTSEWSASSEEGSVLVNIAGPVARIEIDYNSGDSDDQYVWVTDVHFSTLPADCDGDGIVSGTAGDDLIDIAYTGDPEGDMIDNEDAILPGEAPNDDIVLAGDGDDTVISGEGSDDVYGGEGDDLIDTGNAQPRPDHPSFQGVPVDAFPDDDRDSVDGGEGNDTISTGDDADTIFGGAGDDSINAGIDDDEVQGGDGDDWINGGLGNDLIDGGEGDDTIIAGQDAFSDYIGDDPNLPTAGLNNRDGTPALRDPNPNDDLDTVYGGVGNDIIFTGDDADMIYGGAGNDTIHAGIDDDYVEGNAGDDSITGGHGSDTIYGGGGDDWINAGDSELLWGQSPDDVDPVPENGRDFVDGGAGNDTIFGQDDDDTLLGGAGDDVIDGGIDEDSIDGGAGNDSLLGGDADDTILGGTGNDTLIGGEGNDDMSGGDDRDVFLGSNPGDVIDGGEGGDDYDTLDLSGSAPAGGRLNVIYADDNPENGTVEYFDADGASVGSSTFVNIENVIPCFTPGTVIATPKGERLVEELRVGDRIITRDNGIREICWLGAKALNGKALMQNAHLKPVLIQKGALGNGLPERDMLVSPNHRILVASDKAALYFDEREVLAAAKHLTAMAGVDVVETTGTTYIHFMFDQHEVVLSNGAWTESFQPGDLTLKGIGEEQRNEILELFPEMETAQGVEAYQAARRSLKKHEARLLTS